MEAYLPCPDLWVITTYFNPVGYQALRRNYARFAAPIVQAGLNLVTVECAFGEGMFEFTPSPQVIQVRTNNMLWLKERLINLAIVRQGGTQRLSVQHTAFGNALTRQIRHLQQQGVLRKGIDATKLADTLRLSFFGFLLNPVSSLDTSRPRIALLANLLSVALTA